jgi:hypothetical protein
LLRRFSQNLYAPHIKVPAASTSLHLVMKLLSTGGVKRLYS